MTDTTIDLKAGWNLVGYPSNSVDQADTVLTGTSYDGLQWFDNGAPYLISDMAALDDMVAGGAYWVHVTSDTNYVVTY